MIFCNTCNNMMFIRLEEGDLIHYCKNCNFSFKSSDNEDPILVSETSFDKDVATFKQYMTKYIEYDPTLPRVNNIVCPNKNCKTEENEVIYIKYDQNNMKYIYYCCKCKEFWKKNENINK